MFLKLRTVHDKTMLLNSKMITSVTFDADPEHRTIIRLIDDAVLTVIDGSEAFKDINRDDGWYKFGHFDILSTPGKTGGSLEQTGTILNSYKIRKVGKHNGKCIWNRRYL